MKPLFFYLLAASLALFSVITLTAGIGAIYAKYFSEALYVPFSDFLSKRSLLEIILALILGCISGIGSGSLVGKGLDSGLKK